MNLASLNPNQSYTNSLNVNLPEGIASQYYILVRTDAYTQVLESNEGNNISSDSAGTVVNLTPPPDLFVTSIIKPGTAFSGQTINVQFTVKNQGSGGTRSSKWWDFVYLNNDSLPGGTLKKTIQRNGALDVDSSYTVSTSFTLPLTISGGYYVTIRTDVYDNVYEHASESNNNGISDSMRVILTPPPDLIVSNVEIQDTASNKQNVNLKYQLINQGGSPTTSAWYDYFYISEFNVFDNNSSTYIGGRYRSSVGNGDTLFTSQNITIPDNINGTYYVYVHSDVFGYQFEGNNDTNNVSSAEEIQIISPDLKPLNAAVASTDTSGKNTTVEWDITNIGEGSQYLTYVTDKIYLSRHNMYHPDSVTFLGQHSYSLALSPGDTVHTSKSITIPNGTTGNRYFFVHSDANNSIFENSRDSNNYARSNSMDVKLAPYPDLKPTAITTVDSTEAGQTISLTYSILNQGIRSAVKGWKDKLFISKDSIFNPNKVTLLKSNTTVKTILQDSTYYVEETGDIPVNISAGNYYFYIYTDQEDQRYEYVFENNNVLRSNAVYIDGYPPIDLKVTSLSIPDTAYSGQVSNMQWSVKNIGDASTIAPEWFDRLYLSTDTILDDNDIQILNTRMAIALQKDSSYTNNISFNLPNGISGTYCILLKADARNDNTDEDTLNNIYHSIVSAGVPKYMHIVLSKSSDLQITAWDIQSTGTAGQPTQISWEVENKGDTTTSSNSWNDKVYLSTDYIINNGDYYLGNRTHNGNLAKGASYTDTSSFYLPSNYTGNYIVIIKTDDGNREYEHNAENNNIVSSVMTISAAPPGDLIVSSVSAPNTSMAGGQITVNYEVKNTGSNPISGYRTDNVYISEDSLFDSEDILFASRTDFANLIPKTSKNLQVSGSLNSIKTGDYYMIVFADVKDNINETDNSNNTLASGVISVSIPELPLDVLTPDSLFDNKNLYYQLIIPDSLNGETILITLKGDSINGHNEIYTKLNEVPTRSDFDYNYKEPYAGNQEILIPAAAAGTHYILVYGTTSSGNKQNISLLAKKLDFSIRKVSPIAGGNTGQVTLKIEGSKFDSLTIFSLLKPGVIISPIKVPDSTLVLNPI
ncbi:MAG: CARDB domain-containing protein [Bacteroidia bacterium]